MHRVLSSIEVVEATSPRVPSDEHEFSKVELGAGFQVSMSPCLIKGLSKVTRSFGYINSLSPVIVTNSNQ